VKKLIINILLAMAVLSVYAPRGFAGDDLFPWPWGTECPFPWKDIDGLYIVDTNVDERPYDGHYIVFNVETEEDDGRIKYLDIRQYNRRGEQYARGRGYSQKDQRIVKGVLKTDASGREYTVMVRSYVSNKRLSCKKGDLVTAITFCPLRGKKCLENANYTLRRATE
jgi:hypothetical protein